MIITIIIDISFFYILFMIIYSSRTMSQPHPLPGAFDFEAKSVRAMVHSENQQ